MTRVSLRTSRCPIHSTPSFNMKSRAGGHSHRERRGAHGTMFHPGSPVLESGIYEVIHDNAHRTAHEVVLISRDRFPSCDTCLDSVRFRLVRTAPYIFQDADFEEGD